MKAVLIRQHTGLDARSWVGWVRVAGEAGVIDALATWQRMNVLAVEMAAAGLHAIAHEERVRALAVLTVSDHLITQEETSSDERERTFSDMITVALDALVIDAG